MDTVIKAEPGRVVLYWQKRPDNDSEQPWTGSIAYAHSDRMINVGGFNSNGEPYARTSVPLVQPGDPLPETGGYCTWMPYQVAQGQKQQSTATQVAADMAKTDASGKPA